MSAGPPEPLDSGYEPPTSIAEIRADAPIDEILAIIERDGGVILTDFTTIEELALIDYDVELYRKEYEGQATKVKGGSGVIPQETLAVPGLVGKSPTIAKICQYPVLKNLRTSILEERFCGSSEGISGEAVIDPLLSYAVTFWIGPGAPRQRLHRDDYVHLTRHEYPFDLKRASQFGCLIAGTKTTRQNGATMFIPGSHKWGDKRKPRLDEICFAEMVQGSALIFLASCYHGGGHNSTKDEIRKVHGLFFIRGTLRTEENMFLAVPRSKVLGMSEEMLSLLGYKKPVTILGTVDRGDPAQNLQAVLEKANK